MVACNTPHPRYRWALLNGLRVYMTTALWSLFREGAMPGLTCTCASSGVEVVFFLLLPVTEGSIFGPEKSRKIRHAKTGLCRAVCWAICNKLTTSTKEERETWADKLLKQRAWTHSPAELWKILSAVGWIGKRLVEVPGGDNQMLQRVISLFSHSLFWGAGERCQIWEIVDKVPVWRYTVNFSVQRLHGFRQVVQVWRYTVKSWKSTACLLPWGTAMRHRKKPVLKP